MTKTFKILVLLAGLTAGASAASEHEGPYALYLANAGVMVVHGDTKVVFDPLFRNDYGQYDLVPRRLEFALIAGEAPFDGVDAIFVSHAHSDHFDAKLVRDYLKARPEVRLFAPAQVVAEMEIQGDHEIKSRVTSIDVRYGDAPVQLDAGNLHVEAAAIPHSGWPKRMTDLDNLAFRVTLDNAITVVHLGDADSYDVHFRNQADYWQAAPVDIALPPFWFFLSDMGTDILSSHVGARHSIGVHVPTQMPDDPVRRPREFQGFDLFTTPGEKREIE